jgi:1-acyl-sn-glycerol-3-phosphate acyltransferase
VSRVDALWPLGRWTLGALAAGAARVQAHGLGQFIRAFGSFAVRRGESDREAVRRMREVVREGGVLGVFVEGTRQKSGVPGEVQPGAAMVALQEDVPVICGAIDGSQTWKLGNFAPTTIVWGAPMRFEGLPKGAKGYREASESIGLEIHRLWEDARRLNDARR